MGKNGEDDENANLTSNKAHSVNLTCKYNITPCQFIYGTILSQNQENHLTIIT